MTFQDVKFGRVVQSVAVIFVVATTLYFALSCLTLPLLPAGIGDQFNRIVDAYSGIFDEQADQNAIMDDVENEVDVLIDEYGTELYIQSIIQWSAGVLVTFVLTRRAVRRVATSSEQAVGYGILIGLGTLMTFGALCVLCNVFAQFLVRLMFMGFLVGAGYLGGRSAGVSLDPNVVAKGKRDLAGGLSPGLATSLPPGLLTQSQANPPGGGDPAVFYNMGVAAAMGGRRDEARQHFTRALQMQPRNIAAWLQLANLADTPEQAWGYIQQARAISPNDPSVVEAVNVIWPQVHARSLQPPMAPPPTAAAPSVDPFAVPPSVDPFAVPPPVDPFAVPPPPVGPPSVQPPYRGGGLDDADIPRTTLPGSDDFPGSDDVS